MKREFSNGTVYELLTEDGYPLEVTDTFLPDYTKMAVNENTNALHEKELGSRKNRWMIGVKRRHNLIPIGSLLSIKELGQIRTKSNLKTTVNMTLVDTKDFDIDKLKRYFDPEYFFIKLSPINENNISEKNHMGKGIIKSTNLL